MRTTAIAAFPQRHESQFDVDSITSAALLRRFQLLLGSRSQMASPHAVRGDKQKTEVVECSKATSCSHGACRVSPCAALEALTCDKIRRGHWIEQHVRGADGQLSQGSRDGDAQESNRSLPSSPNRDVHVCFRLDKDGWISLFKADFSCTNRVSPTRRVNSVVFDVFPCQIYDREALTRMAIVYVPDLDALRLDSLRRPVGLT